VTRSFASTAPSPSATGRIDLGRHPSLPLPPLPRAKPSAPPAAAAAQQAEPQQAQPQPGARLPETSAGARPPRPRWRRLAQPPGKRAPLWLAALIAGALVAAWPSLGSGPTQVRASAADYGLGTANDGGPADGSLDAARSGITAAEAQTRLAELAASRAAREPKTVLPTQGVMSTCFCMRWGTMHWGLDLAAPLGTPIYAAVDGVVLQAGPASGYGNAVYIQDADGNVEIYGHMRYYNVKAGNLVHAGDQIAKVGSEGQSTGPHLHFELHRGGMNGKPFDPLPWLAQRGVSVPGA
jgi:murein DD-endopeptidase MepM/ murein hydrolase activator NlpD